MATKSTKPFVLIDGSSYLHRAFHALPPLMTTKGQPTGAIYGVINMIRKLIADYDPELIAVVFDTKGKTTRHHLYPQYKATRPPMAEELRSQIAPLHQIITAMGLPLILMAGIEADDIIGTLAHYGVQQKLPVVISTGDKDMVQLVNDHTTLINTMSNLVLDRAGVINKYGLTPEQIVDYLALIGDTSDNIPGVPMVGPKTAVKLLQEYGSLDTLIKHAGEIKGKVGENLRATIAQLPLIRQLLTIDTGLKLDIKIDDLKRQTPNHTKLRELFTELEFKSWLTALEPKIELETKLGDLTPEASATINTSPNPTERFHLILTTADLSLWLNKLQAAPAFAFDLETTSLDIMQAEIVGIAFALTTNEGIYIPVAHDYLDAPTQLNRNWVLEQLKPLFENPQQSKLAQNIKYDLSVLQNYDIKLQGQLIDTMLESYVLDSAANQHNKETLVFKHLGKMLTTYEDLVGKGAKQLAFSQVSLEKALPYAALDAVLVQQLHKVLWPQIAKIPKVTEVFTHIEMPLVPVLANMERRGVCIDVAKLQRQSTALASRIEELEQQAHKLAGAAFNLNSPLQLQEILFKKQGLPIIKKTPKKQPSTAEDVLQELALDYELPKVILEYRSLSKLKSTYTDALPLQINPTTGRIHTSYNQAITATGRLSSTNPNLQNIPARSEEGRKIRECFVAPPGYQIISADYSQIELRIMAHLSGDPGLLQAFAAGDDVHRATAAEIFDVNPDQVTQLQRQQAKTINFGLIYGMSAFGLAQRLGLEREEAERHVASYFAKYPGVKVYMEAMREQARKNGYVETIFGRRIYTPEILVSNFQRKSAAERAAINAPMQGSAADIIKVAMIRVEEYFSKHKIEGQMIMQVHDELVFEAKNESALTLIPIIKEIMQNAVTLSTPIIVHCGIGDNWDRAH